MISFLAIAGIFGISSTIINNNTQDTPVAEKAEAASDDPSGYVRIYFSGIDSWSVNTYPTFKVGPSGTGYASVLSASGTPTLNAPFNSSNGKYVCDLPLSSAQTDNIYNYFQSGSTWYHPNDGNDYWSENTKIYHTFTPAYIVQINLTGINHNYDNWAQAWYDYTPSNLGYFIHYDYNGGTAATGTKTNQEATGNWTTQAAPSRSGYAFSGWKRSDTSDVVGSNENLSKPSGPITLTAQWTQKVSKTIYYISAVEDSASDTPDYIYAWTGEYKPYGDWHGTAITTAGSNNNLTVVKFRGTYKKIYRITLDANSFIINNNDTLQTQTFTATNNSAYRWSSGEGSEDSNEGAALAVIYAVEAARNAVPASGSIKQWSICGISSSIAADLYSMYTSLNSTARGYVDSSLTYTYNGASSTQTDVSFSDIFNQLAKMQSGTKSGSLGLVNMFGSENSFSTIIIIISSSVALLSVTALSILVIRKRKSKEQE